MRIAVFICGLVFDCQKAFMKGVERKVRDCGDTCLVFCCHVNASGNDTFLRGECAIFNLPNLNSFDGIIYVRNTFLNMPNEQVLYNRILSSGVPCVAIDSYSPEFLSILSDERAIAKEVTRHLIECHNCRKLYFLGGPKGSPDTEDRYEGFKEALLDHNLPVNDDFRLYGNFEFSSGVDSAQEFLNLSDSFPDAIVCANDEMAIGLISELKRRGVKVPKDIKVTGIDFDTVSRVFYPRLTSVKRQQYQKGVNAINLLHEYSSHTAGEVFSMPVNLYIGASCGCIPEEDDKNDFSTTNTLAIDCYAQAELSQTTKRMTADLMAMKDQYALLDELKAYALKLRPDEMHLCLNVRPECLIDYSDYSKALLSMEKEIAEDYTDEIMAVFSIIGGVPATSGDREYFEKEDLFPPLANGGKKGGTYYFLPIHYMNRNYGYAILGTSGELLRNEFFPNYCNLASNALETTRKRNVLEQMLAALDHMWIYDALTGVYNRAGFFKRAESMVNDSIHKRQSLCVIFLDVDGLKKINDTFGHDEGDNLIKEISGILKKVKRHNEVVMRYGGDEFVLLAPDYTEKDASECILRIEAHMNTVNETPGRLYPIEASIGYCITVLDNPDGLNALIERADREMYKKKRIKKIQRY